jgi:hypothetical protein
MQTLDDYLQRFFGDRRKGEGRVAVGDAHAVFEAGFDVRYSRYSVTYRDALGEVVVPAEFDDEGVLLVQASRCRDPRAIERIGDALAFLGVRYEAR